MKIYRCYFDFNQLDGLCWVDSAGGIADFRDGFWIGKKANEYNNEYIFYLDGKDDNAEYWIPSSKIKYIHKANA